MVPPCRAGKSHPYDLFDKVAAYDLLLQKFAGRVEFQLDFDPLEAMPSAQDDFAYIVHIVVFVIHAQIVAQVNTAFDDLAAAIALHREVVEIHGCLRRFEEFLEEAHIISMTSDFKNLFDPVQLILAEVQVIQRGKVVVQLLDTAGADQRGGHCGFSQ